MRGELENRRRSGRPKKITPRDCLKLERLVKVNRRDTLSDINLKLQGELNNIIYMKMDLRCINSQKYILQIKSQIRKIF